MTTAAAVLDLWGVERTREAFKRLADLARAALSVELPVVLALHEEARIAYIELAGESWDGAVYRRSVLLAYERVLEFGGHDPLLVRRAFDRAFGCSVSEFERED